MKKLLISALVAVVPAVSVWGKTINIKITDDSGGKGWHCLIKAFMDQFEGIGDSKTEAVYQASQKCKAKNHEIHFQSVNCESDDDNSGTG